MLSSDPASVTITFRTFDPPGPCGVTGRAISCIYRFTGSDQTFVVPAGVTSVQVTAIGAAGGEVGPDPGGRGAQVTATLTGLTAGQALYVVVGEHPVTATTPWGVPRIPFNGGGLPGFPSVAGAGGGATDVRTVAGTSEASLRSRLIVARGGGGRSQSDGVDPVQPGDAGQNGSPAHEFRGMGQGGYAGTQVAGGAGGAGSVEPGSDDGPFGGPGALGQGGSGAVDHHDMGLSTASGGGGGGLYGGGGGGAGQTEDVGGGAGGGGGGGSSLVPPGGTLGLSSAPASVTITYTPGGASVDDPPSTAASGLLTALIAAVKGVGPGSSLVDKVTAAQRALAALDTHGACSTLTGVVDQLAAQSGKQIAMGTANQRLADVRAIRGLLGC